MTLTQNFKLTMIAAVTKTKTAKTAIESQLNKMTTLKNLVLTRKDTVNTKKQLTYVQTAGSIA